MADPWLDRLRIDYDEARRWIVMHRRALASACNLGADAVAVPANGEVVLAWGEPTVDAKTTRLEGHSFAVVKSPSTATPLWITDYRQSPDTAHDSGMSDRELLPVPPIESATDPVHSAADMRQRWRALMGPLGFGERLLWFSFLGPDRRLMKVLSQVPIGPTPRCQVIENLMSALQALLSDMADGTTVAMLLTRPGPGPISNADRRWLAALTETAARFDVRLEPIFRANDESLVQIEPEMSASH